MKNYPLSIEQVPGRVSIDENCSSTQKLTVLIARVQFPVSGTHVFIFDRFVVEFCLVGPVFCVYHGISSIRDLFFVDVEVVSRRAEI
jgi:hypothetical protein